MKCFRVHRSQISGEIEIPPSKSHTLRAVLFASLADGKSFIRKPLLSSDGIAMIEACRLLGAKIEVGSDIEIDGIKGVIDKAEDVIQSCNSGIVLRFLTAIAALSSHPFVITGDHSIRHRRPIKQLIGPLRKLGAKIESMRGDDMPPLIIQGPIQNGSVVVDGEDSQPVSALLIAGALGPGLDIHIDNPGEKPWIDLTFSWLDFLKIPYERQGYTDYKLPGHSRFRGFEYTVPGDLSSAAFPIAAALITKSELLVKNIDLGDVQGDKKLFDVFRQMGAPMDYDSVKKELSIKKGSSLKGVDVDINDFIDAIACLSAIACYADGETRIRNASVARNKESNRIEALVSELSKMGANIRETPDGIIIQGSLLKGSRVHSYHDHRMAMALAIAGLGADGETIIEGIECVQKTYPAFLKEFNKIGAKIDG